MNATIVRLRIFLCRAQLQKSVSSIILNNESYIAACQSMKGAPKTHSSYIACIFIKTAIPFFLNHPIITYISLIEKPIQKQCIIILVFLFYWYNNVSSHHQHSLWYNQAKTYKKGSLSRSSRIPFVYLIGVHFNLSYYIRLPNQPKSVKVLPPILSRKRKGTAYFIFESVCRSLNTLVWHIFPHAKAYCCICYIANNDACGFSLAFFHQEKPCAYAGRQLHGQLPAGTVPRGITFTLCRVDTAHLGSTACQMANRQLSC